MGKTIRRKSVSVPEILNTVCYTKISRCAGGQCSYNCPYRDVKDTISRYRRDTKNNYGWRGSAPSGFRRGINRVRRAKDKAKLRYINTTGDYDGVVFDKWVKDAGWLYW